MSWRSRLSASDRRTLKEDAVHLLLDEARVLEGDRPADARSFSERLARVLEKSVAKAASDLCRSFPRKRNPVLSASTGSRLRGDGGTAINENRGS